MGTPSWHTAPTTTLLPGVDELDGYCAEPLELSSFRQLSHSVSVLPFQTFSLCAYLFPSCPMSVALYDGNGLVKYYSLWFYLYLHLGKVFKHALHYVCIKLVLSVILHFKSIGILETGFLSKAF